MENNNNNNRSSSSSSSSSPAENINSSTSVNYGSSTINVDNIDLHVMFLPFLSPGHMIPLVDLAKIMASHHGVRATVVTTAGNSSVIRPSIEGNANIDLLTLPFNISDQSAADHGAQENIMSLPTPQPSQEFMAAVDALQPHFERLVRDHRPDCIVADTFFPWANDVASQFGIPRIAFQGSGSFPSMVLGIISHFKAYEGITDEAEPFLVPKILPHPLTFTISQLPDHSYATGGYWTEFVDKMGASVHACYGSVLNSFYEVEPEYADMMRASLPTKMWHIGPVSLFNHLLDIDNDRCTYDKEEENSNCLIRWLDKQPRGSVVYVCFGSLGQFTPAQLREMASGLDSSGHPFLWAIKGGNEGDDEAVLGTRSSNGGMVVRGWVPQVAVLAHPAVGGFVTHCGWNSFLEAASAGVPMIAWPLFAEQFANEKLIVDLLKIGVAVGSKKWSNVKEERTLVTAAQLRAAVEEVMGKGEEAKERRARAKKVAEMARAAVSEGGSSHRDMMQMIQDLKHAKLARTSTKSE